VSQSRVPSYFAIL